MGIDEIAELEFAVIKTLFEEVSKKSEREKIADASLELLLKLTGSQCGFILMHDAPGGKLSMIAEKTGDSNSHIINDVIVETVLGEAKEIVIDDMPAYNRSNKGFYSADNSINSVVCVPVITSHGVCGALYLGSPEKKILYRKTAAGSKTYRNADRAGDGKYLPPSYYTAN